MQLYKIMQPETRQLAQIGLESYGTELTPFYKEVSEELLAQLALSQVSMADLMANEERRRTIEKSHQANANLLMDFAYLLPKVKCNYRTQTTAFTAYTPYQARAIQSSAFWDLPRFHESHYVPDAYYVLGKVGPANRPKQLLVAKAQESGSSKDSEKRMGGLFTIKTGLKAGAFGRGHLSSSVKSTPYTSGEMQEMYRPAFQTLAVSEATPGSLAVKTVFGLKGALPKQTHRQIEDRQLAEFNVLEHLYELATKFELVTELKDLLAEIPPIE